MSTPTMTTSSDAHARRSDPLSSHLTVQSLGRDRSLKAVVVAAALELGTFNDTELTDKIEELTGRRQQRNVIARTRGLLEADGWFDRIGMWSYLGRPTVHFQLTRQGQAAANVS